MTLDHRAGTGRRGNDTYLETGGTDLAAALL
jgi:hypothetical protein